MNESAMMTDHAVAVYATHNQAEEAIKLLNNSGYNMKDLSIVGQNYETEEHPVGFVNTGDRMWSWGKLGIFWGSIWGLLFGSAMMFVPGVGVVVFAGWLVALLEGAVLGGGFAAMAAAKASIGIPKNSVVQYESDLKAGSFLLLIRGSETQVQGAKDTLAGSSATRFDAYSTKQLAGVK